MTFELFTIKTQHVRVYRVEQDTTYSIERWNGTDIGLKGNPEYRSCPRNCKR